MKINEYKDKFVAWYNNLAPTRKIAVYAVLISLMLHTTALLYKVAQHVQMASSAPKKEAKVVKINLKKLSKVAKAKQTKKGKKKYKIKKQIVNSEKSEKLSKPQTDRFLGAKNQMFDRQSIAKKVDRFKEAGKGTRKGVEQKVVETAQKTGQKQKKNKAAQNVKKYSKKLKNMKLSDLSMFATPKPNKKANMKGKLKNLGLKNGKRGLSGLAQNNDFIEDIPLGDFTRLNTQEFKFYGFYHRIRQRLEQYWGNKLKKKAEKIYRSGRRLPASENLITSLQIILDSKGNIVNVVIKGSSGVKELDDAAIEAFNNAGPFPNPPTGMVRNGKAIIEWGFVVKS